jgi:glycogen(starch) synthase
MRILVLNYEFPPLGGGAGNASKSISKELAKLGHEVTVITTWFKNLANVEEMDGYRIIRVHSRRQRKDRSNTLEMLHFAHLASIHGARLLKRVPKDYILSFFALPTGLAAWYLNKRFDVPYILSLRGGDVPGFLPAALRWHHFASAPLTRCVWKNASEIVANSEGLKKLAERTAKGLGKRIVCIPNGVDTDTFRPEETSAKCPKKLFSILFVGRLTEQKGATHLLKALAEIRRSDKTASNSIGCTIIGDGPLRNALELEARELDIQGSVAFRGWMDRTELPKEYAAGSLFVLPTSDEGMPNVVLEAMASGLPVIATNVTGNNEVIQSGVNGILVKDTSQLSGAILDLYYNAAKAITLGQEARKAVLDLGWGKIAKEYGCLFI